MGGVSTALEELRLADHMIYVTLPLLDDKRVFINAVGHIGKALKDTVRLFMQREADYKQIPFMPGEDLLVNEFINRYSSRLGLQDYIEMLKSVVSFNDVRGRSSIKLKKNDKFIVISPEYSMVALTIEQVKAFLRQAREFVSRLGSAVS